MHKKINQTLIKVLEKNNKLSEIIEKLKNTSKSQLLEFVGDIGTGKSYLAEGLVRLLEKNDINYKKYEPKAFQYNQLKDIMVQITDIDSKYFEDLLSLSKRYESESKFDFFYFLSEKLNKADRYISTVVVIDNAEILDEYSRQFIQYLIEYAKNKKIHFVVFSEKENFPFSQKIKIEYLSVSEINNILLKLYDKITEKSFPESEILQSITKGNIALLERILSSFIEQNKLLPLDLTAYLDRDISHKNYFLKKLKKLSEDRKKILLATYFLEDLADKKHFYLLKDIKNIDDHLEYLVEKRYIRKNLNNKYLIEKKQVFHEYYKTIPEQLKRYIIKVVFCILEEEYKNEMRKLACYYVEQNIVNYDVLKAQINYLSTVNDFESLLKIKTFMLKHANTVQEQAEIMLGIGVLYRKLNKLDDATEYFRKCLRLSSINQLDAEKIVYYLAESQYSNKSYTFAWEVIKKFSPDKIDPHWEAKIYILKARILCAQELFSEAEEELQSASGYSAKIKDPDLQQLIKAECRKTLGRIFYEKDQWERSEIEFFKAEKIYKRIDNLKGLAAIYNNIGVLAVLQGEWEKAEKFYNMSLELERKRYSLDGISVCYNNIGYIVESKGDFELSLNYFQDALRIQKLLCNSYNITNIYNNIGVTYMNNGDYKKAVEATENSLDIAMKFNLYKVIIAALNNLGSLYFKWGDWNKAISYHETAIEKSKDNSFWEGLLRSYNNLGVIYENKSDYNVAYDLYFKGSEILPKVSDESLKYELRVNLGSVLTNLHKYEKAYPYLIESYEYFKNLNAKDLVIECSLNLALYFKKTRNYESAKYYINKAMITAEEIHDRLKMGKAFLLQAELEKSDLDSAQKYLESAIEIFVSTKNNYELSMANYEYANILYKKSKWEQALQILKNNEKIIKNFEAINLLEKNDILIQKISKKYSIELKETRNQESLLNKFYEITNQLNSISDFELLLETALESIKSFSEADGGIMCLYHNNTLPSFWEYLIFNKFQENDESYDVILETIYSTYSERKSLNYKQPHFAPLYNNIITFPMVVRNKIFGVILLFTKSGSHYFTEKMLNLISALANQIVVIIENIKHINIAKSHAIIREELNDSNIFSNIIGKSKSVLNIFNIIEKVKDAPTTILLEGKSGTGKELFARAIHFTSNRRNKKFIAQYCGALPETLLESELFGHVKGAFTGAAYDKKGLLEIADGGTFFLDEIADISLSTQAKLLRFLQEGEVKRVGSTKTQKINVRVVCATNVSLKEKVDKGEFRLDLYYRLNVIKIDIPSLLERRSDIPLLAVYFLDKYNNHIGKKINGITDEAMKYLKNYSWPGNIRQLENEIERAVTLADNDTFITPTDLSEEILKFADHLETIEILEKSSLKEAVDKLERQMIESALKTRGWNQTRAAKDLGLSRQGLIKKIKRFEIER